MTAISTEEFDRRFDEGEDLEEYMDTDHVVVREAATHRLVITPPEWVVRKLDAEAERCGIPRKALINTILVNWADNHPQDTHAAGQRSKAQVGK